jgi:hypothetical protein
VRLKGPLAVGVETEHVGVQAGNDDAGSWINSRNQLAIWAMAAEKLSKSSGLAT